MSEPEPFQEPPSIDLPKVHGAILREHNEPAEGCESVPLWLVGVFMALVFWGGWYLAYNAGGFRADAFNPRPGMSGPPLDLSDPVVLGKYLFTQNCVLCHQADGLGVPRIYPPLAGSDWVQARGWHGDNHLVSVVLFGMQGPVEVGGQQFNNAMPGWSMLRDEQLAAVLNYVRSQWGNSAPPLAAEYVGKIRAENAGHAATAWTPEELQALAREQAPAPAPAEPPIGKARQ